MRRGGNRLTGHPRFRAAYDFLLLRATSGEVDQELADWWTEYQEENGLPQPIQADDLEGDDEDEPGNQVDRGPDDPPKPKKRRRRRRRRRGANRDAQSDSKPAAAGTDADGNRADSG